jgi:hypothetical protein
VESQEEKKNPTGNWNTKRSRLSVLSRVTCLPQTTRRLRRLPQNLSRVCPGLIASSSQDDLCTLLAGLDNLPSEISFLLTEIQHIDVRSQGAPPATSPHGRVSRSPPELQQEVAKEASRYIRHSGRSTPSAPPNPKDAAIQETIKEHYAQIEELADEKLVLAQRVVDLISRARAKLDHDLSKVLVQQGEDPHVTIPPPSSVSVPRRNVLQEIKETLRTPRETTPVVSVIPTPPQVTGNKSEGSPSTILLNPHPRYTQGDELPEALQPDRQVTAVPHLPQGTPELGFNVLPASLPLIITTVLDSPLCLVDKPPRWKPRRTPKVKKTMAMKKTRIYIVSARSSHTERQVLDAFDSGVPCLPSTTLRWLAVTTNIVNTSGYVYSVPTPSYGRIKLVS